METFCLPLCWRGSDAVAAQMEPTLNKMAAEISKARSELGQKSETPVAGSGDIFGSLKVRPLRFSSLVPARP